MNWSLVTGTVSWKTFQDGWRLLESARSMDPSRPEYDELGERMVKLLESFLVNNWEGLRDTPSEGENHGPYLRCKMEAIDKDPSSPIENMNDAIVLSTYPLTMEAREFLLWMDLATEYMRRTSRQNGATGLLYESQYQRRNRLEVILCIALEGERSLGEPQGSPDLHYLVLRELLSDHWLELVPTDDRRKYNDYWRFSEEDYSHWEFDRAMKSGDDEFFKRIYKRDEKETEMVLVDWWTLKDGMSLLEITRELDPDRAEHLEIETMIEGLLDRKRKSRRGVMLPYVDPQTETQLGDWFWQTRR